LRGIGFGRTYSTVEVPDGARAGRLAILKREKHECKLITIKGDALSCVLLGALIAGRLPTYGQSILRFLRDLREYRDGK
jgi:hypothetical protein